MRNIKFRPQCIGGHKKKSKYPTFPIFVQFHLFSYKRISQRAILLHSVFKAFLTVCRAWTPKIQRCIANSSWEQSVLLECISATEATKSVSFDWIKKNTMHDWNIKLSGGCCCCWWCEYADRHCDSTQIELTAYLHTWTLTECKQPLALDRNVDSLYIERNGRALALFCPDFVFYIWI